MEYRKRSDGVIVDNTIAMNNKSPEEIAAEIFPYFKHKMTVEYSANQHTDELRAAWVLGFNYLLTANGVLQRENQKLREDLLNAVRIEQELREEIKNAIQRGRDEFKDELQQQLNALGTMHFKVPPKTDKP